MDKTQKVAKRISRSRKDFLENEMTDRQKVIAWLDRINEHDEACRAEILDQCAKDKEARTYYVSRYEEEFA